METARYKALRADCESWRNRKAQLMRQYFRCKNLREKDHNTEYFHTMASMKRKRNLITRIKVNNDILMEVDSVRRGIRNHFENLYHDNKDPKIELPQVCLNNSVKLLEYQLKPYRLRRY